MSQKQKEYIFREQEYRRTIEEIKREIDQRSQKPLQVIPDPTDDEIQLRGIKLHLKENDLNNADGESGQRASDARTLEMDAEMRNQVRHPNPKDVKKLHEYIE